MNWSDERGSRFPYYRVPTFPFPSRDSSTRVELAAFVSGAHAVSVPLLLELFERLPELKPGDDEELWAAGGTGGDSRVPRGRPRTIH